MTPYAMRAVADQRAQHLLESAARDRRAAEAVHAACPSGGVTGRLLSSVVGRGQAAVLALYRGLPSPRIVTPSPMADRRAI